MPPVVLTSAEICDDAGELAVGGKPFLPELLISRELLGLTCVSGLKQIGQYGTEHDPGYCGKARDDAIHLISRPHLRQEFTQYRHATRSGTGVQPTAFAQQVGRPSPGPSSRGTCSLEPDFVSD